MVGRRSCCELVPPCYGKILYSRGEIVIALLAGPTGHSYFSSGTSSEHSSRREEMTNQGNEGLVRLNEQMIHPRSLQVTFQSLLIGMGIVTASHQRSASFCFYCPHETTTANTNLRRVAQLNHDSFVLLVQLPNDGDGILIMQITQHNHQRAVQQ